MQKTKLLSFYLKDIEFNKVKAFSNDEKDFQLCKKFNKTFDLDLNYYRYIKQNNTINNDLFFPYIITFFYNFIFIKRYQHPKLQKSYPIYHGILVDENYEKYNIPQNIYDEMLRLKEEENIKKYYYMYFHNGNGSIIINKNGHCEFVDEDYNKSTNLLISTKDHIKWDVHEKIGTKFYNNKNLLFINQCFKDMKLTVR